MGSILDYKISNAMGSGRITLPPTWLKRNNVKPGDRITVFEDGKAVLMIANGLISDRDANEMMTGLRTLLEGVIMKRGKTP
jgi:bifunctional DNA-binding transcriptional regulator/antitoxin component of YhaV-PrlF toxin-antitoxin module